MDTLIANITENLSLSDQVAMTIRKEIIKGHYHPGQHLLEASLCEKYNISRNTLREAFRSLTKDGLLHYRANCGVFVTVPNLAAIIDVYNVRRIVEVGAVRNAHLPHPSMAAIENAVQDAETFCATKQWQDVGTADIKFHKELVNLADSPRLAKQFSQLIVELRLIFGLIKDVRYLHEPFVANNRKIVDCLKKGNSHEAAELLDHYLIDSERVILNAYARDVC